MKARAWRGGLGLGAVALAAAVGSGSRPLGVVGVGFLLAWGVTWLWASLAERPVAVALEASPEQTVEGDRVSLSATVTRSSRIPLGSLALEVTIGRLGRSSHRLRGHGRVARASVDLGLLPRGVYATDETEVVVGDLLGLVSVRPPLACEGLTIVVRPRLVSLDGLFSEAGRVGGDGRRLLLRRAAGFDFHSVREYEQGESLRRVHWPTSARRGQLMVKELEDTAHDGVVVLLDCDPAGAVGSPPDSSFDAAVRAAGSILQTHAARGRGATLVTTGSDGQVVPVRSARGELGGAVTCLAAACPDARHGLARALHANPSVSGTAELVIVTATLDRAAFSAVLAVAARRATSLVWVDAASFAARPTRADTGLLRLTSHGIPTAVVRKGDDLAAVLSARSLGAVAHG
jgi:uncharacterized protein (DUF58 family)